MFDGSEGEEPEWVQHERETFKTVRDANGDGFMDFEEVRKGVVGGNNAAIVCCDLCQMVLWCYTK